MYKESYRYYYYMSRNRLIFADRHFERGALVRVMWRFMVRACSALAARLTRPLTRLTERDRAYLDASKWVYENRRLFLHQRACYAGSRKTYQIRQHALYRRLP
jgi:hypothetical protein